jgi:intein/homing endonuclease
MFYKIGENSEINVEKTELCTPVVGEDILEQFTKFATSLKKVAPKADDFLYFSAIMMHAAEASAINDDGSPKLTLSKEQVKVGWDKSGNTWKWTTNDPNVKPYKNCFIPGTQILMQDGSVKNIEDVEPGDMVITHTGKAQKVLKKFITPHSGNLLELKIKNNQKIVCTDNHPFYHVNLKSKGLSSLTEKKKNDESFRTSFSFSKISDLEKGTLLLSPVLHTQIKSNLNPNKARLLGIYAAEGSFSKKYDKRQGVRFTVGINEEKQAELIKSVFEEEFPECSVNINKEPSRSIIEITATGYNIADYFYYHCGEYSHTKKLSKELVFADDDTRKSFLAGWIDGDGCLVKDYNKIVAITVSPHLANQIRIMLNSMGISNSLRKVNVGVKKHAINKKYNEYVCKDNYRIELYGDSYKKLNLDNLSIKYSFNNFNHKIFSNFEKDYCLHLLKEINSVPYNGDVYNLEVEEDHSYIANGIIVSNCNGDIFPEEELIKAHKKWIGKPLCIDHKSNSVDHVRGFIVDTYYDRNLKRIVALCALDKHNYPDLARKVSTGYSNNVSMGVGVNTAICTECGKAAKVESDFCDHMKRKTSYGEINIGLNPIELSIVVNGADPKAYIKHIIAAANTLNSYVDSKEKEFNKIAGVFRASLSVDSIQSCQCQGVPDSNTTVFNFESKDLESFKQDINNAIKQLEKITETFKKPEKDTNDLACNQSSGTVSMGETESPSNFALSPPHERYASTDVEADLVSELIKITSSIQFKLDNMKQSLDKLEKTSTTKQEENMSESNDMNKKGYFQGATGDEPTPGQPKYPKDPSNEKLRTDGDKHMNVQDTGAVEDLYPGDLERKKLLARAEAEERAMRRNAIVNLAKQALEQKKEAYFQGGGGVNEPSPGKVKYAPDKLQEDVRESSDKHMVGQKPFPGVGDTEGLHPSPSSADVADEKKRKEMLNRASLRARFVKAANNDGTPNFGNSEWEVFLGDKLLLTASVNELSGGRAGMLYDSIATKEFGSKLIEKVKVYGVEKVRSLVKSAQTPAVPETPMPEASAPVVETPAAPAEVPPVEAPKVEAPKVEVPKDTGKSGDTKETATELAEKVRDLSSDLVEAVRALTGEQAEMGQVEETPEMGAVASDINSLQVLRKELNGALNDAMKQAVATLNDHQQELEMIVDMYNRGAINENNKDMSTYIVEDALNEAKTAVADGFKLMTAFIKYARATKTIVKRAEMEEELNRLAPEEGEHNMKHSDLDEYLEKEHYQKSEPKFEDQEVNEEERLFEDETGKKDLEELDKDLYPEESFLEKKYLDEDKFSVDDNDTLDLSKEQAEEMLKRNPQLPVKVTASFDSKQGRAILRAKLAAEALKMSPVLQEAHPKGGFTTQLDVKPSDDLAKVEDLEEAHDAMMDLAKAPPTVRKEAEAIHRLIKEGKLDPADLDALIAEGLDKDAVAYYKKYYAQTSGGSEFASELVKEHIKAEMEEELNNYKVKLGRAYELAYDMVERDLCRRERSAISEQVDEIMKYNDESFESLKRVVAKHTPNMRKEGYFPQVGVIGSETEVSNDDNLVAQISAALSKTSKGMF